MRFTSRRMLEYLRSLESLETLDHVRQVLEDWDEVLRELSQAGANTASIQVDLQTAKKAFWREKHLRRDITSGPILGPIDQEKSNREQDSAQT